MYLKVKCLINLQAHYLCFHFPSLGAVQQLLTAAPSFPEQENEQFLLFVQYSMISTCTFVITASVQKIYAL